MKPGSFLRLFAFLLLVVSGLPAHATVLYSTSIIGELTIDALIGGIDVTQVLTQPASADTSLDPPGNGTASASASFNDLADNTIRVLAATDGSALPSNDLFGTLSFASGTVGGGLLVTNTGMEPLQLIVNMDIAWSWTLLVDNPLNEMATAALSLDLYADGQFVESLVNLVDLQANGSDSLATTLQLDLGNPLANLAPNQSRLLSLVASTTAAATSIPVPGTLYLVLVGMLGLRRFSAKNIPV